MTKEQYRFKIKHFDICPYLNTNKDVGFSNAGKVGDNNSIYTEATISSANFKCEKSYCYRRRICIRANTKW